MPDALAAEFVISDTRDLRNFLIREMVALSKGEIDAVRARHITNFAQQIYNTLNVELKAARLLPKPVDPVGFIVHDPS